MTLWIHGFGHANPENEISNRFLEELDIGTSDSWILERVGIRSRRTVLSLDYIRHTLNADVRAAAAASSTSSSVQRWLDLRLNERSVSPLATGISSLRMMFPVSIPTLTKWAVTPTGTCRSTACSTT